jgi:hypothetical protein
VVKKNNSNIQNFKWWYRVGQAFLENYHEIDKKKVEPAKLT